MTPMTTAKAVAIAAAIVPTLQRADARIYGYGLASLLARLTSANKDEREAAKREVRELVKFGTDVLQTDQDAADLANFANRHEP